MTYRWIDRCRLLPFLAFVCSVPLLARANEPNETFAEATLLLPGVLTTGLQSFDDSPYAPVIYADTTLGYFTDATFTSLVDVASNPDDDGGGKVGNGLGSGLFELDVLPDGSIPLAVGGFIDQNQDWIMDDMDFDGLSDVDGTPHTEQGLVNLIVSILDIGNPNTEYDHREMLFDMDQPGETLRAVFQDDSWIGHRFNAFADNTVTGGNDVDFWRFTGLPPGATYAAETSSFWWEQDTILGLFDDQTGTLLAFNDDFGPAYLSRLTGTVSASGELVFAVTSFDDYNFIGAHGGADDYSLTLTLDNIPIVGDFDGDQDVDRDDLSIWQNRFGGFGSDGDADFDGDIDGHDFLAWQRQLGTNTNMPANSAIPEPASCVLLLALTPLVLTVFKPLD